jgi:hypothetical protein
MIVFVSLFLECSVNAIHFVLNLFVCLFVFSFKDERSMLGKSLPEMPESVYAGRKASPSHVMIGDQKIFIGGAEGEHIERDEKSKKVQPLRHKNTHTHTHTLTNEMFSKHHHTPS